MQQAVFFAQVGAGRRRVSEAPLCSSASTAARRAAARASATPTGRALAEASGAAANVHVDFAAAVAVDARASSSDALERAGVAPGRSVARVALGLGLAGVNDQRRRRTRRRGFSRLRPGRSPPTTPSPPASARTPGRTAVSSSPAPGRRRSPASPAARRSSAAAASRSATTARARISGSTRCAPRPAPPTALGPTSALTRDILAEFGGDVVALVRWARDAPSPAISAPSRRASSRTPPRATRRAGDRREGGARDRRARARAWSRSAQSASRWSAASAKPCGPISTPDVAALLTPSAARRDRRGHPDGGRRGRDRQKEAAQ